MSQFVGLSTPGVAHDVFAYDAAGRPWNGTAYAAWSDADFAGYRVAAAEQGASGRYVATLPDGVARWELRVRAGTLAGSRVRWEDVVVVAKLDALLAVAPAYPPDVNAAGEVAGQGSTVVVTPVLATANNPRHTTRDAAPIYAGSAPVDSWTVVDGQKNPVDLSEKTVRFVVASVTKVAPACDPFAVVFGPADAWGTVAVGGDDGNLVTVVYDPAKTSTPGLYTYWLLDATDRVVLATGALPVKPIGVGAWG